LVEYSAEFENLAYREREGYLEHLRAHRD
jgi:hypothetical protein